MVMQPPLWEHGEIKNQPHHPTRTAMNSLSNTLQRCEGYCELGMWKEAQQELSGLPPEARFQPDAMWRELKILIGQQQWAKAAAHGITTCRQWPDRAPFFLETIFALEQAGRIKQALKFLRTAPAHVWDHAEAWYSLACLNARMTEIEASRMALGRCFELDENWKLTAMYEPALAMLAAQDLKA